MRKIMTAVSVATFAAFGGLVAINAATAMPHAEYDYPSANDDGDNNRWDLKLARDLNSRISGRMKTSKFPDPGNDSEYEPAPGKPAPASTVMGR